ncbi:hypothetical protein EDB83DRAFT_472106 [Lactarius deliciosus]|nr:hypothetical protein EDB83DRAFT_472106 [Lactarius deliciosus]
MSHTFSLLFSRFLKILSSPPLTLAVCPSCRHLFTLSSIFTQRMPCNRHHTATLFPDRAREPGFISPYQSGPIKESRAFFARLLSISFNLALLPSIFGLVQPPSLALSPSVNNMLYLSTHTHPGSPTQERHIGTSVHLSGDIDAPLDVASSYAHCTRNATKPTAELRANTPTTLENKF